MSRSIDRLASLDRLMLGASKRWPQDIGALAILDGAILLDPAGAWGPVDCPTAVDLPAAAGLIERWLA